MRVTSSLWVAAFLRRCQGEGAVATLSRRGAEEAGAIAVVVDRLDGRQDLYLPAPQTAFKEEAVTDRLFERVLSQSDAATVRDRIERERRFDPDMWVVDVEDRAGRAFLDLARDA